MSCPWEERVLGGDPALGLSSQPTGDRFLDGSGTDHPCFPHLDEDGSFRVIEIIRRDRYRPEFIFLTSIWAHVDILSFECFYLVETQNTSCVSSQYLLLGLLADWKGADGLDVAF